MLFNTLLESCCRSFCFKKSFAVDINLSRSSDCSPILFSVVLLLCCSALFFCVVVLLVLLPCSSALCVVLLSSSPERFSAELDHDCLSQLLRLRFAAPAAAAVAAGPAA